MEINEIQDYLVKHELDGWLMADFHARNTVAISTLGIKGMLTRRSFYFIPVDGEPIAVVHAIEKEKFKDLPGTLYAYSNYRQLEAKLKDMLSIAYRVAMEYSPKGRLPYIGLVDAGTIELVRECGVEIVSSADLVAHFQARLSAEQIALHRMAARNLIEIKELAFEFIAEALKENRRITEYDVCLFMRDQFETFDMETSSGPNCSVDAHAGDPHYEPSEDGSAEIKRGQLVLFDIWAKVKHEQGIYGDITWMGFTGTKDEIPEKYVKVFEVLASARDKAVAFLRENIDKQPVYGYEVDDVCRGVVNAAGYGDNFTHRTGHSITTSEHGTGPNIDNLETEDRRKLQKGHLFSVEPGIYLPEWGLRTEIDVLIGHDGVEVTTLPLQTEIRPLF
jgi:Xaa-Pro aminopeptidase